MFILRKKGPHVGIIMWPLKAICGIFFLMQTFCGSKEGQGPRHEVAGDAWPDCQLAPWYYNPILKSNPQKELQHQQKVMQRREERKGFRVHLSHHLGKALENEGQHKQKDSFLWTKSRRDRHSSCCMWVNRDGFQKNKRKRNVRVESDVLPPVHPHSYVQEPTEG